MPEVTLEAKLKAKCDKLWDRIITFTTADKASLLHYLMGYCGYDEHFLNGVESGINDLKLGKKTEGEL